MMLDGNISINDSECKLDFSQDDDATIDIDNIDVVSRMVRRGEMNFQLNSKEFKKPVESAVDFGRFRLLGLQHLERRSGHSMANKNLDGLQQKNGSRLSSFFLPGIKTMNNLAIYEDRRVSEIDLA